MAKSETKVKDLGIGKIFEELAKLEKDPFVKVGFPADLPKSKKKRGKFTNIDIAFVQEFGSPDQGIPERSHIRAAFDENVKKLTKLSDELIGKIYDGVITVEKALGLIGEKKTANIQKKIRSGIDPPLKSRSGTPLLDTGQYVGSVGHKVFMKGGKK